MPRLTESRLFPSTERIKDKETKRHLRALINTLDTSFRDAAMDLKDGNFDDIKTKSPWFDVRAYGAKGDGITDDTSAIQDAINDAESNRGGIIFLPTGTYLITDTLTIQQHNITLLGTSAFRGIWHSDSDKVTIIKRTTAGDILQLFGNSTEANNTLVQGIAFEGSSTGSHLVIEDEGNAVAIINCSFKAKDYGIKLVGVVYDILIKQNMFTVPSIAGVLFDNTSAAGKYIRIKDNYFRQEGTSGESAIKQIGSAQLVNVTISGNEFAGFNADNISVINIPVGIKLFKILDNDFEGFSGTGSCAINIVGQAGIVSGNLIDNGTDGIKLQGDSITIGTNMFSSLTGTVIELLDTTTKTCILPQLNAGNILDNSNQTTNVYFDDNGQISIGKVFANAMLDVNGSSAFKRTATATDYNTTDETIIGITDTSVVRTITLASADCAAGRIIIIKDESGGAGTNNITVTTEGTETIDGATTQTISTDYGVLRVYSDGTNWFTF